MEALKPINQICKEARAELKRQLPDWKFSVTNSKFAGGSSMTLALMAGPVAQPVLYVYDSYKDEKCEPGECYHQLNPYTFTTTYGYGQDEMMSNGSALHPHVYHAMRIAVGIAVGDRNDFISVHIGRWDRPYVQKAPKRPEAPMPVQDHWRDEDGLDVAPEPPQPYTVGEAAGAARRAELAAIAAGRRSVGGHSI